MSTYIVFNVPREWYLKNWHKVDVSDMKNPVRTSIVVTEYIRPKQKWCEKNLGSNGTVWINEEFGGNSTRWYEFFFANEQDAIAFKLACT